MICGAIFRCFLNQVFAAGAGNPKAQDRLHLEKTSSNFWGTKRPSVSLAAANGEKNLEICWYSKWLQSLGSLNGFIFKAGVGGSPPTHPGFLGWVVSTKRRQKNYCAFFTKNTPLLGSKKPVGTPPFPRGVIDLEKKPNSKHSSSVQTSPLPPLSTQPNGPCCARGKLCPTNCSRPLLESSSRVQTVRVVK